jgi:hypothetical protein
MILRQTILIAIASFLIGCAIPVLHAATVRRLSRYAKGQVSVMLLSGSLLLAYLILAACGLVYLSTIRGSSAPIIAIATVLGIGFGRLIFNVR